MEKSAVAKLRACIDLASSRSNNNPPKRGAETPKLYLPRELGSIFERRSNEQAAPTALDLPTGELIATLPFIEVEEAASLWGARVTPGVHARAELVNVIREQIERPDRVAKRSGILRPAQSHCGGPCATRVAGYLDAAREVTRLDNARFRIAVRELGARLLVWHHYEPSGRVASSSFLKPFSIPKLLNPNRCRR